LTLTPTNLAKPRWEIPIVFRIASTRGAQNTLTPGNRFATFLVAIAEIIALSARGV